MENQQGARSHNLWSASQWLVAIMVSFTFGLATPVAVGHFRPTTATSAKVAMPPCSDRHFLELVTNWYDPQSVDHFSRLGGTPAYCRNDWGLLMNFEVHARPGIATALFNVQNHKWHLVTIFHTYDYWLPWRSCPGLPPAAVQAVGTVLSCRESTPKTSR